MELYFPTSEYDLETVSSVLFSLVSVVLTALMIAIGCFPESKLAGLFFAAASKAQGGAAARKEGGRGAAADRGTAGTASAAAGKANDDQVTMRESTVRKPDLT